MANVQYRFQSNETLVYHQEFYLVASEDDSETGEETPEKVGRVVLEQTVTVTDTAPDGWAFQVEAHVLKAEGPLSSDLPPAMRGYSTTFTMNSQGIINGGQQASGVRWPVLPSDGVEVGDSWDVEEHIGGVSEETKSVEYLAESFEVEDEETILHLVALGEVLTEDESQEVQTNTSFEFSVTHGHMLSSRTTLELATETGVILDVASSTDLIDQRFGD